MSNVNNPVMTIRSKMSQITRFNQGFTLIELIVTIAIGGIVLGMGIPSFTEMMANSRMASFTNDLVTEIYVTRSEAVKRGTTVTICSSNDQATCANSNNWGIGWIIFQDAGTAGVVDGADEILYVHQPPSGNLTVTVSRPYARFLPSGYSI